MKIKLFVITSLLAASQICLAADTSNTAASALHKVESTANNELKKQTEQAKAATLEKKKKKSFFAIFDIVGKVKEFVGGKSKQNTDAIEQASNGTTQARPKRQLSSDPKTRAIQEKLDKLQAERLKKYEGE